MSQPYSDTTFVLALPRSRTAWLANLLNLGAYAVHDPLKNCASIDELGSWLDSYDLDGRSLVVVDTAAVFFFDKIRARFPGARFLFIRREQKQVIASFVAAMHKQVPGYPLEQVQSITEKSIFAANAAYLYARNEALDSRDLRVMTVDYSELSDLYTLAQIWRFTRCTTPPPPDHWFIERCADNIQVSFQDQAASGDHAKMIELFKDIKVG